MPLDPSFRSRLREALQQSAVGKPARSDSDNESGSIRYVPESPAPSCDGSAGDAHASWIAEALGGEWRHDGAGVCLVLDRYYPASQVHGSQEIGGYAETLSRYKASLSAFDRCARRAEGRPTLFAAIDEREAERPEYGLPAEATGATIDESEPARRRDERRFLFFDLETTGLSGGAGTCAFLIGYGWFDGSAFRTRQYFLSGYGHEAAMLRMAAAELAGGATLASFNGKTFDVPLIQGRYLFHRVRSPFEEVAHVDMVHAARRLWRYRPGWQPENQRRESDPQRNGRGGFGSYFRALELRDEFMSRMYGSGAGEASRYGGRRPDMANGAASCALGVLEQAILSYTRTGDVPGMEIPTRYFRYVRSGDVRPLAPVLEHNRLDLLSLAALSSVVARLLEEGPAAARNPHECLALGRVYERSGAGERATACYLRAADGADAAEWHVDAGVEREALRRLALQYRRERRYDEAARIWERLDRMTGVPTILRFEALHALAVHHEHRSGDLPAARAMVLRALEIVGNRREQEALRRRLARLDRKLGGIASGA